MTTDNRSVIHLGKEKLQIASLVIFLIIFLDQLTKALVLRFGIGHACNTGFAFGILQGILNGLIAFLVLLVVVYVFVSQAVYSSSDPVPSGTGGVEKFPLSSSRRSLSREESRGSNNNFTMLGLALIIGGGMSNIVDRLIRGCVVDFIDLVIWPAFNLADVAITVGVGILIFSQLKNLTHPWVSSQTRLPS